MSPKRISRILKTVFAFYLAFGYTFQSLPGNVPGGLSAPGGDRAVSGGYPEERRHVFHARIRARLYSAS